MRHGEIWVASFNPARGREVGKSRPCVIVQADPLIASSETIFALPLTTQAPQQTELLRLPVPARNRLRQDCFVMIDHGRALDRPKFTTGPLATLTVDEMAAVEEHLKVVLGLL